jgi:propionate CoA-transferase
MFDFYSGGGLDIAFVSFAEVDANGDVNVTRFGSRNDGAGGFIEITQNTRRIVFSGTFTGGDLGISLSDGSLQILNEGRIRKFVPNVNQVSFNGQQAITKGVEMIFITERVVLRMTTNGLEVSEYAPGIDIDRDVLSQIPFPVHISNDVKPMDSRIFCDGPMGIRDEIIASVH